MKTTGIFFLAFGILGGLITFTGSSTSISPQEADIVSHGRSGAVMFIVLGAYLLNAASKRQKRKERKQEWNKKDPENK